MAIKFYSSLDLRTNQLKHALLHTDSSAPTSPTPAQGQIYYNSGDDTVYTYDGSSWNGLASASAMTAFILEDDDGTEVSISNAEEVKFIGSGITTNWTDTSDGSDSDPFDLTFTVDAAQTGITSILATALKIGEDDQTKIDFETANEIHFYASNIEQVYLADNIFGPQSDSDVDLGTTGVRWKDAYMDNLYVTSDVDINGDVDVDGTLETDALTIGGSSLNTVIAGTTVSNATTAAVATAVTITDNESTNEDNAIIFTAGGDVDGGNIGLESDGDLTYNPSTGTVTATIFKGNIDAVDGDFDGTLEADAITVGGSTLASVIAGTTVSNATTAAVATTVTITDNESTNEDNALVFTSGGDVDGGNIGLESDGTLTYNPSDGTLTATGFAGTLTGNADTVTNGVYTSNNLSVMAATTSAQLAGVISNETGSGSLVFATSPTLVTPALGTPASGTLTNTTGYPGDSSLVTSGALNSGSITSGFGTIDTGSSTITTTGAISGGTGSTFSSASASEPVVHITNTHSGATAGELRFNKDTASGDDNDVMGTISWYGTDAAENTHQKLAYIDSIITDSAAGSEAASMRFYVAENDGTNTLGLTIAGQPDADGEVDVTIGAGAGSTTTITGDLTVSGTTTTVSSTTLSVTDDLITCSVGNDTVANADGSGLEIEATGATNLYWKYVHANTAWTSNVDIDTSATSNVYKINGTEVLGPTTLGSGVVTSSLTTVGTIGSGTWNGTAIGDTYVANDLTISGGTVDNSVIGGTTAAAITGTTIDATTDFTIGSTVITDDSIVMTPSTSDTATIAASTNGALAITTVDNAAAAANITITADGTFEAIGTTVTLDSGGAINLEPATGSAILLDGTISVDAGVVTGATSITSTAFAGDLTGDVTGNADSADLATTANTVKVADNESTDENNLIMFVADAGDTAGYHSVEMDGNLYYNPFSGLVTATGFSGQLTGTIQTAAQTGITSLGTLTALTVDNVNINGTTMGHTGLTDAFTFASSGDIVTVKDGAYDFNIASHDGTNGLALAGTVVTSTATELNLLDGITTLSGSNTGDESTSSTSTAGVVELATSAETITGTDSGRAVTPDGLAARTVVSTIDVSAMTTAGNSYAEITHSLGTEDVIVQLFDATTKDTVHADVLRTDKSGSASTSKIKVLFAKDPTVDVEVVITSFAGATAGSVAYS